MSRLPLAIFMLLALCLVPAWSADPAPAVTAERYPAAPPAAGAPVDPAVKAGLEAAEKLKAASAPWYTDVGTLALAAGGVVAVVLEKQAPQLMLRFLPAAAGPYGGIIQLILQGVLWLLKSKGQKAAEQLQADHAEMGKAIVATIQTVSNDATIAALKTRLLANLDPELRATIDNLVTELEKIGVDHDTHGSGSPSIPVAVEHG